MMGGGLYEWIFPMMDICQRVIKEWIHYFWKVKTIMECVWVLYFDFGTILITPFCTFSDLCRYAEWLRSHSMVSHVKWGFIKLSYSVTMQLVLRICLIVFRAHSPLDMSYLKLNIFSYKFLTVRSPRYLTHLTLIIIVIYNSSSRVSDLILLDFQKSVWSYF